MTLTAQVPTTNASRYLQQLCKHWSHKMAVEFDEAAGFIDFPMGPIRMTAGESALTVVIEPTLEANVDRFKQVVADHLDRFAFREAPLTFDWQ